MAVTFALMSASRNLLKYKVTADGIGSANIDAAGAATPDLLTDAVYGSPLRTLISTTIAAQAAGRTLAFDRTDLIINILPRDADAAWIIEANTDGASHLRLTLTAAAADALGCYLTIEFKQTPVQ